MADEKKTTSKATDNANVIRPPAKAFRWADSDRVTGKLMKPITAEDQKFGRRTCVYMDTCSLFLPSRYAPLYKDVPVNANVTVVKSGQGRDTEYVLSWTM